VSDLPTALTAEHAAIFGYGIAGAHLTGAAQDAARAAEAAHRARRDALLLLLAGTPTSAPPAAPVYALPFPVTDGPSAMRLAIHLEERTAAVWQRTLGTTTGDQRRMSLDALTDCAVRATRWRKAAGVNPATVPLPGTT